MAKKNDRSTMLIEISNKLLSTPIYEPKSLPKLNDLNLKNFETCYRRLFFSKIKLNVLFEKILINYKDCDEKIKHPLPKTWQLTLEAEGFKVNRFISTAMYFFVILKLGVKGILSITKVLLYASGNNNKLPPKYAMLVDFPTPMSESDAAQSIFLSRLIETNVITPSDANIIIQSRNNKKFCQFSFNEHFFIWNCATVFLPFFATVDWKRFLCGITSYLMSMVFRGRVDIGLGMLDSYCDFCVVTSSARSASVNKFLFDNGNWYLRPLWTYGVEERGGECILYAYSANNLPLKKKNTNHYYPLFYGYTDMPWDRYLAWDQVHKRHIVECCEPRDVEVKVTGSLPLPTIPLELEISSVLEKENCRRVCVFDVSPRRMRHYRNLGNCPENNTAGYVNQFLADIESSCSATGTLMLFKSKRTPSHEIARSYTKRLERLGESENCHVIDPKVSAESLIRVSDGCICMPFTSPSLIAMELDVPVVFYDPHQLIDETDISLRSNQLINTYDDLVNWMTRLPRSNGLE